MRKTRAQEDSRPLPRVQLPQKPIDPAVTGIIENATTPATPEFRGDRRDSRSHLALEVTPADAVICLRFRSERSEVPQEIRLRRLLKTALRQFRFRCVEVSALPESPPAGASPRSVRPVGQATLPSADGCSLPGGVAAVVAAVRAAPGTFPGAPPRPPLYPSPKG